MKWTGMKGPILALTWMDEKLVQMTGTYTSCPGAEIVPLNEKGRHKERRCYVCSCNGKRKQVIYVCPDCDVGLCPAPCFK
eukprot:gene17062-8578_t